MALVEGEVAGIREELGLLVEDIMEVVEAMCRRSRRRSPGSGRARARTHDSSISVLEALEALKLELGKRKNDMVRPSFGEQGPHFIFQSSFYTLSYA